MGEVYRARDTRLDRTVAVKILPTHLSSNPELNARFQREARAVSALNHPNICHLYDIGSQDGMAFLVMEYLDGESLAQRLLKGSIALKQVLEFGIQIAQALATAHKTGVLHRDLKPQNVMLTASGAKLLDFGLAKSTPVLGATRAAISGMTPSTPTMTIAELSSPAQQLTRQGTILGTHQYMAPEVLQGAEADARSDVFSLGCVLYEMVTGRRAFEGKSQLSVLTAILEKDPEPISQIVPTTPATLDHVIKTCLEKNPEERFQTAQDVRRDLKWIADGGAPIAVVAGTQKRPVRWWVLAGISLLVAAFSTASYIRLASRPPVVVRSSILPPAGTTFLTVVPASGPPALSPDGTRLAFTARDEKGKTMLYVRSLAALTAQALTGTDDATYPFWAPDNRQIGYFIPGKLMKIDASGGPPQTICVAINGRGGAWGKEGVIVFTPTSTSGLLRVSASGGIPEPASKLDDTRNENSHRWPQFLPDGKHFLFWARSSTGAQGHSLYVGLLGSLQAKPIVHGTSMAFYASGYLLFVRETTLMVQPFDASRFEVTGDPVPIAENVTVNGGTGRPIFSVSENGTLVYQSGEAAGGWSLLWSARDGKPAGFVAQDDRFFYPRLSPDGNRLAVTIVSSSSGTGDVWIYDLKRGNNTRLTFGPAIQHSPTWTPDGKTVFFSSNPKGTNHIYAKAADGSGSEKTILESNDASEVPGTFSPDGRYLTYDRRSVGNAASNTDIWVLPLTGDGKPFPIVQTPFDDANPAVSPDGRWMAYQNNESGRMQVYVTAFPGGGAKWQASTNGGGDPRWRKDGKELFFLDATDTIMVLDVSVAGQAVQLGIPHSLFQAVGAQRQAGSYDVTADGKKFVINGGTVKQSGAPFTLVQNWTAELRR
jgi:serine/threonine protein kinase/Tol biopolymer transport system component